LISRASARRWLRSIIAHSELHASLQRQQWLILPVAVVTNADGLGFKMFSET